jgi:large subunit ribosomal protein L23
VTSVTTDPRHVILAPVVSEKSYGQMAAGTYTFRVHPKAHKTQVKQAVEALFNVHVVDVRTVQVRPKPKRRGMIRGTRPGFKKAVVQLRAGDTIELFEGVA